MTDEQFGALALQLLNAAQIPGDALETAMAFKQMAQNLAGGRAVIVPAATKGDDE